MRPKKEVACTVHVAGEASHFLPTAVSPSNPARAVNQPNALPNERVMTRLANGCSRLRIPEGVMYFSFLHNVEARSGAHPATHSTDTAIYIQGRQAVAV